MTEAIRRSLPAHLARLLCRRRQPPIPEPVGTADRVLRPQTLVYPKRLTEQQTRRKYASAGDAQTTRHGYNIGHINARSLIHRLDEVNDLLQRHNLDILGVSESWLTPKVLDRA